jgi:hypothetical protein
MIAWHCGLEKPPAHAVMSAPSSKSPLGNGLRPTFSLSLAEVIMAFSAFLVGAHLSGSPSPPDMLPERSSTMSRLPGTWLAVVVLPQAASPKLLPPSPASKPMLPAPCPLAPLPAAPCPSAPAPLVVLLPVAEHATAISAGREASAPRTTGSSERAFMSTSW